MINRGATPVWARREEMEGPGMYSRNHPMHGSVDAWLFKFVVGIQLNPDCPGFEKIIIKPFCVGDLTFAEAQLNTFRGDIRCRWELDGNIFRLNLHIPVNSRADVFLPQYGDRIFEGNHLIWDGGEGTSTVPGLKTPVIVDDRYLVEVGSGNYCFMVGSK
jgi:alpha-L-rhamnosidase